MGDLIGPLGDLDQAHIYVQKSLEIRERLAHKEPDRAVFQTDLVASLVRLGDAASLLRALAILQRLDRDHKLLAAQSTGISLIE